MGTNECSRPASKSSWDNQDFGDISMVLQMAHFRKSTGPRWVKKSDILKVCTMEHDTVTYNHCKLSWIEQLTPPVVRNLTNTKYKGRPWVMHLALERFVAEQTLAHFVYWRWCKHPHINAYVTTNCLQLYNGPAGKIMKQGGAMGSGKWKDANGVGAMNETSICFTPYETPLQFSFAI